MKALKTEDEVAAHGRVRATLKALHDDTQALLREIEEAGGPANALHHITRRDLQRAKAQLATH